MIDTNDAQTEARVSGDAQARACADSEARTDGSAAGGTSGADRGAGEVTVRYFAGARAAAGGVSTEVIAATTLDDLIQRITDRHGERLGRVLKSAGFLVDGLTRHDGDLTLTAGSTVDVLPPFAGG